jgi:hypothetical protein
MHLNVDEEELEAYVKSIIRHTAPYEWVNDTKRIVGDNTYEFILKRLQVLEELCLEHRADWAEQRLQALEHQVSDLKKLTKPLTAEGFTLSKEPVGECKDAKRTNTNRQRNAEDIV